MIFRYPSYYEKFACIADRCEDTCCAGWEIDIDDRSYQYYQSVPGDFGRRLRENIQEYNKEDAYEKHGYICKDGRCPFLNDRNLCDLYIELGEDALCYVCANTPRDILEYGGQRELAISASCPEAGRLIYGDAKKTTFIEKEINEKLDFEESPEEILFARWVRRMRDRVITILQDRTRALEERIRRYLAFSVWVQENINAGIYPETIPETAVDPEVLQEESEKSLFSLFLKRVLIFSGMECINGQWRRALEGLDRHFVQTEEAEYGRALAGWQAYWQKAGREHEYEHLLVYYAFLCQSRCVDDYDFLGKTKFVVTSFLMIRDMDILVFIEQGRYGLSDRVKNARIYAREVEHSEENLGYLAEVFLFEDAFSVGNLSRSLC